MDKRPIRLIHWNARGLARKVMVLRVLLKEHDVDLALISETYLGPRDNVRFPGYHVYRRDEVSAQSGRPWRGLAVLVRRRIVHQPLPVPAFDSTYLLGVELHLGGTRTHIYSAYKPPNTPLNPKNLRDLFLAPQVLIAGNLNSKHPAWNSSVGNAAGAKLHDDAGTRGYTVMGPEVPTRYPDCRLHISDVLDIVVHNDITGNIIQQVLDDDMGSDHQPVLVVLDQDPTRAASRPRRLPPDWGKFRELLEANTPTRPISTAAEVNLAAAELSTCIRDALTLSTPPPLQGRRLLPLPARIRRLLEEKRRVRRSWQRDRCPRTKSHLNRLSDQVKAELREHSSEDWERRIESMSDDWTAAHRLCRSLTNAPKPVRPLRHPDGTLRYGAEDRANILSSYLETHFSPHPAGPPDHEALVAEHLRDFFSYPIPTDDAPIFFSPSQTRSQIKSLEQNKAPGADGITNKALRQLPPRSVVALTRLFNGCLRAATFPDIWKTGRIVMIPKKGKNSLNPESYRPITLLSSISKVFERLVLAHLLPHIPPRPEQFGFRTEHSATLQLSRVLHQITFALNKRERAAAVFLDMEKAFDRVWHAGLLYKLSRTTASRRLVCLVRSFLEGRSFRVMVDGSESATHRITAGVPQGSCLSPALYSHYTDDIPVLAGAGLALYADDVAYISTSLNTRHAIRKLQRTLDAVPAWMGMWRLRANVGKTQAIAFPWGQIHLPRLRFLGREIAWTSTARYLGVTLDSGLSMKSHVLDMVHRARAARAMLRPILNAPALPLRVKLGVYKTYIRSIITYAAPAWYALASEWVRIRLRAQQHLALRSIVRAPRLVRNATIQRDLRIEGLDEYIRRLATNMFARADASSQAHIRDIAPWHARPPDHRRPLPRDLAAETGAAT